MILGRTVRWTGASILLVAAPGLAREAEWRHAKSGVSLPETLGDMRRGTQTDLTNGEAFDVAVQYGQATEPVTIYVYRSAYPNPALWFERTRHAMRRTVGAAVEGLAPRRFLLGGAANATGLREEITLENATPWRSTAVAMAQAGEWIVKARISSQSLDRPGIAAKMDRLLRAFRFANPPKGHAPMTLPGACAQDAAMDGKPIKGDLDAEIALASVFAAITVTEARGWKGLAVDPQAWCRQNSAIPTEHATIYRRRDGKAWVALVGDAGRAVSAQMVDGSGAPTKAMAASYATNPQSTRLVALFDALPTPDAAVPAGWSVAFGQSPGLAEIRAEPNKER